MSLDARHDPLKLIEGKMRMGHQFQVSLAGPLVQIMNDEAEIAPARRMAAEILASFRDGRSAPQFIEVLKNKQEPLWLRSIALDHLKNLSNQRKFRYSTPYVEALEIAAGDVDKQIAESAQKTLKKIETKLVDDLFSIHPKPSIGEN